jgi:HD-like signal output (HDOD) protein/ActR/RegA family two-component response regulator
MKRILFVDDEKQILDGIRRLLSDQSDLWEMQFAQGGEEALKLCQASRFDVVVSDMRMPGMDGATLLGHVRDLFPDAARLILSGYSDLALATRAISVAHRVLAKPCDGIELQTTIESFCARQDLFCSSELRRVIGTIGELPSLSRTYMELARAAQDPNTSLTAVAEIMGKDVAMAAKVLQLVNSGFFGLAHTVTSLKAAVAYLGMDTLRNLALASDTFKAFTPGPGIAPSFCEDMQRHAQRAAFIVGTLPLPAKLRDVGIASALLHDIGELVLACKLPHQFCAALELARTTGCSQVEAEEQIIGTTHAEIGAYLLGLWSIDSLIVEAVAHHHRPDRIPHTSFDASTALYVADRLARELDEHPDHAQGIPLGEPDDAVIEALGLSQQYSALREEAVKLFS